MGPNDATQKQVKKAFAGIILAGGKGTRMGGISKPRLNVNGRPLIHHVLEILAPLFDELVIAAGNVDGFSDLRGVRVVRDQMPGCGPLGGLQAGLNACTRDWAFVVASDMPCLRRDLILQIAAEACTCTEKAVIPTHGEFFEPLHAAYRKDLIPNIDACLRQGRRNIMSLAEACPFRRFPVDAKYLDAFYNINTPHDLPGLPRGTTEKWLIA